MAEVVPDANVIVALLYEADSQHRRARELVDRLERADDGVAEREDAFGVNVVGEEFFKRLKQSMRGSLKI